MWCALASTCQSSRKVLRAVWKTIGPKLFHSTNFLKNTSRLSKTWPTSHYRHIPSFTWKLSSKCVTHSSDPFCHYQPESRKCSTIHYAWKGSWKVNQCQRVQRFTSEAVDVPRRIAAKVLSRNHFTIKYKSDVHLSHGPNCCWSIHPS